MEYIRPEKIEDISRLSDGRETWYLAGGTDIMVMRKERELQERPLIDISGFSELKEIRQSNGVIEIGALVTMSQLESSPVIRERAAALAQAASEMGSPLIRNLATIGGNIANSNPAGDTIPALTVLDAELVLRRGTREREVPADGFCTAPGCNVLEPGEIITAFRIPVLEGSRSSFMKIGPRGALSVSKVSLGAWWFVSERKIVDIRIAPGAVGPRCQRVSRTEKLLKGSVLDPAVIEKAAEKIQIEVSPIDDYRSSADYRRAMTGVLLKRILTGR